MKSIIIALASFITTVAQAATLTTSPITGAGYPSTLPRDADTTDGRWYIITRVGTVAEIRNSNLFGSDNIGAQAFYFRGAGNGGYADAFFKFGSNLNAGETVSFDVISAWGDGVRGIQFGTLGEYTLGGGLNLVGGPANPLYGDTYQRAFSFELKALVGNDYSIRVFNKTPSESNPAWDNTRTVNSTTGINEILFFTGDLPAAFDTGGLEASNIDNTGFFVNNISIIPEPSTPLLMGLGLAGLLALRKNRKA